MARRAMCPNPKCNGQDSCFMVDDLTHHKCDTCGTTWSTYDPEERIEQAINIKIPGQKDMNDVVLSNRKLIVSIPPVVTVLTGVMGAGKTTFLEQLREADPCSLQILTPANRGQLLDILMADWDNHACVAVDEVSQWDRASVPAAIAALEKEAVIRGKKLILVTQMRTELATAGVHLTSTPVYLDLSR